MELWYAHPSIRKDIDALETQVQAQIVQLLALLSERGPALGMPASKYLGGKMHELRHRGAANIRVFYTFHKGSIVVLDITKKKSQKLRAQDTRRALGRLKRLRDV